MANQTDGGGKKRFRLRPGVRVTVSMQDGVRYVHGKTNVTRVAPGEITILQPDFERPVQPGSTLLLTIESPENVFRVATYVERVGLNTVVLRQPDAFEAGTERRRSPRAELNVGAEYRGVEKPTSSNPSFLTEEDTRPDGPWSPCRIENLSETGALLRTDDLIAVGTLVYIRLSLPFLGTAILLGRTVRIIPPGDSWGYGIQFEHVSEGDRIRIAEYAASQKDGA